MPNKHQIQKDFYTKKKEWKESLKHKNDNQILFDEEMYPEFKDGNYIREYYETSRDEER